MKIRHPAWNRLDGLKSACAMKVISSKMLFEEKMMLEGCPQAGVKSTDSP